MIPDPENSPDYYPPALTGLRGSHPGSFDAAHSLRDGTFWDSAGKPEDTGETYDLIIVGGGISGLSAAYFYRKAPAPKPAFSSSKTTTTSADTPSATNFASNDRFDRLWRHLLHRKPGALQRSGQRRHRRIRYRCAFFPSISNKKLYGSIGRAPRFSSTKKRLAPTNWSTIPALAGGMRPEIGASRRRIVDALSRRGADCRAGQARCAAPVPGEERLFPRSESRPEKGSPRAHQLRELSDRTCRRAR